MSTAMPIEAPPGVRAHLLAAARLRALAIAFRPPGPPVAEALAAIAATLGDSGAEPFRTLIATAGSDLAEEHHLLFGPGGACPLAETDYADTVLGGKGGLLGDVAGFYAAFRFDPAAEFHEPPDHVTIELSFVSWLRMKEAYALLAGESAAVDVTARARHAFVEAHTAHLAEALHARLTEKAPSSIYAVLAEEARTAVRSEL